MAAPSETPSFFASDLPDGFDYRDGFISRKEEHLLLAAIGRLTFSQVIMRGVAAKRRTAHFGWTYGYYSRRTEPGPPLPDDLMPCGPVLRSGPALILSCSSRRSSPNTRPAPALDGTAMRPSSATW
jgi:hypothetical protein